MIHDPKNKWNVRNYTERLKSDDRPSLQKMLFADRKSLDHKYSEVSSDSSSLSIMHSVNEKKLLNPGFKSKRFDKALYSLPSKGLVAARCFFSIFGIVLYTRLGNVFGMTGLGFGILVVFLGELVAFLTSLSFSAIITNGRVRRGGIYYLVSRSLGPVFGFTIGMLLFFNNCILSALYIIGSAESFNQIVGLEFPFSNQVIAAGMAALIFLICTFRIKYVVVFQFFFVLPVLVIAILTIYAGFPFWEFKGNNAAFAGFSLSVVRGNILVPNERTFFKAFSLFFPGTLGMMAPMNDSHKLKNPRNSLPAGTLIAIFTSFAVYLSIGVLLCFSVTNETLNSVELIVAEISLQKWIIVASLFVATLSQTFGAFSASPEILIAIANDDLLKPLKVYKGQKGVMRAQITTLIISTVLIITGQFDIVAPIVSAFSLITYAMINIACYLQSVQKTPNWRPEFKFFNPYVSLLTAGFFIALIFVTNYFAGLLACLCTLVLLMLMIILKPKVDWGNFMTAIKFDNAVSALRNLDKTAFQVKNYKMQLLILCGEERSYLIDFVDHYLKRGKTVETLAYIIEKPAILESYVQFDAFQFEKRKWMEKMNKYKAFLKAVWAEDLAKGVESLIQSSGISRVEPNAILMGFKSDWRQNSSSRDSYVEAIRVAMLYGKGVILLRGFMDLQYGDVFVDKTIDVYWFDDDGGFCLLVPYFVRFTKTFKRMKIRLLLLRDKSNHSISRLLHELRIPVEIVPVSPDKTELHFSEAEQIFKETNPQIDEKSFVFNALKDLGAVVLRWNRSPKFSFSFHDVHHLSNSNLRR